MHIWCMVKGNVELRSKALKALTNGRSTSDTMLNSNNNCDSRSCCTHFHTLKRSVWRLLKHCSRLLAHFFKCKRIFAQHLISNESHLKEPNNNNYGNERNGIIVYRYFSFKTHDPLKCSFKHLKAYPAQVFSE